MALSDLACFRGKGVEGAGWRNRYDGSKESQASRRQNLVTIANPEQETLTKSAQPSCMLSREPTTQRALGYHQGGRLKYNDIWQVTHKNLDICNLHMSVAKIKTSHW